MVVLKFGGTSVKNMEMIDRALDIAQKKLPNAPLLVSSAMGKTTDKLVEILNACRSSNEEYAFNFFNEIKQSHKEECKYLSAEALSFVQDKTNRYFDELEALIKGLLCLKECSPRSIDAVLSFGELLSTAIIAARARDRGMDCILLDSRQLIKTDDHFTEAIPNMGKTLELIKGAVFPEADKLFIAQGFIASNERGATTTLGRGGSDYTATIFGAALNADQVEIWTDVNGIMTADPRVIHNARTVHEISYEEAAELAVFGAKVVHPSTIVPAVETRIPVLVKNTKDPYGECTKISSESSKLGLKAITSKNNITLIEVKTSRMVNAHGFLSKIFSVFEKYKTSVDIVTTSEVSVSMTIENNSSITEIINDLSKLCKVSVEYDKSIICLVGQGLWQDTSFISNIFRTLEGHPIRMISLGASRTNLSLVIPTVLCEESLKRLHKEFF